MQASSAIGSMPTYDYNALLYLQNKALRSYTHPFVYNLALELFKNNTFTLEPIGFTIFIQLSCLVKQYFL